MGIFRKRQQIRPVAGGGNPMLDAEAAGLVPVLRSVRPQHIPALERELYNCHRGRALLTGFPADPEIFVAMMTMVMPFVLPRAVAKAERANLASDGSALPYQALIVNGANGMATLDGAKTLIGRCVASGVGEFMRHRGDPLALAQWLTFYHLFAMACGPEGSPPDPFAIGLPEGLSATIASAGDSPIFLAGRV